MKVPKTFLVGVTQPEEHGLHLYLKYTKQEEFFSQFGEALKEHGPICLASFYAKLCYKSLVLGKNENVSRIRDIENNITGCMKMKHGAVFEHVWLNFVTTDCSRVFTHELVRHRVGTAFSQTSGRYCTVEDAELVIPPDLVGTTVGDRMQGALDALKRIVADGRHELGLDDEGTDFAYKKKMTSALRRIMPNGCDNEIGWSVNIRALRHLVVLRTSRHAEWEIRHVFNEVADIVNEKWPLMLHGAEVEEVDGLKEYTGLQI